jgi:hypothetical protein
MRKKLPMAAWYDPSLLVQTGIRVAISTVFGEMADRREAMAAANAVAAQPFDPSFDYSQDARNGEFWLDFLADTGDGWDSTYAMAQLLTQAHLNPADAPTELPRGQVLILGGDLVYPTASPESYDDRFLHPFEEALATAPTAAKTDMPDLYAIPGNHDWYDGLGSFFNLVCRRRIATAGTVGIDRPGKPIAGRPTNQTRSYFAIRLPGNWWLWGTDSQLKGYIDQPQVDFFQFVASNWMEDKSKVILCVGMPNWAYVDKDHAEKEFETFSYLERLAGIAVRPPTPDEVAGGADPKRRVPKGHELRLVLTGDSHHYSRYVEAQRQGDEVHYVTCGGGGAFLHPTHQLTDKSFKWDYPPPGVAGPRIKAGYDRTFTIADKVGQTGKALYPRAETSKGLTTGNVGFAFRNTGFTFVFVAAYLLYNWLLHANARLEGFPSLVQAIAGADNYPSSVWQYVRLSFSAPLTVLLAAAAFGGYFYFADSPYSQKKRFLIGSLHWAVQVITAVFLTAFLIRLGSTFVSPSALHNPLLQAAIVVVASAIAAICAATIFGLYLLISLNRSGRHWNEAFSALAIANYKCFLRMKIAADGRLHLYPIGLTDVPKGGGTPATLNTHLIEGPIVIS